ncbi:MAG: hypothetical protein HC893_07125 [Chloroflexaceae bacterium]|nr:hypothetical protein [Chloroflexaceae bacterium]
MMAIDVLTIERTQRARVALAGLSVGDVLGGFFEFPQTIKQQSGAC